MLAIIDYGVGNLFSLSRSLEYLEVECKITRSLDELKSADRIILKKTRRIIASRTDSRIGRIRQTFFRNLFRDAAVV